MIGDGERLLVGAGDARVADERVREGERVVRRRVSCAVVAVSRSTVVIVVVAVVSVSLFSSVVSAILARVSFLVVNDGGDKRESRNAK